MCSSARPRCWSSQFRLGVGDGLGVVRAHSAKSRPMSGSALVEPGAGGCAAGRCATACGARGIGCCRGPPKASSRPGGRGGHPAGLAARRRGRLLSRPVRWPGLGPWAGPVAAAGPADRATPGLPSHAALQGFAQADPAGVQQLLDQGVGLFQVEVCLGLVERVASAGELVRACPGEPRTWAGLIGRRLGLRGGARWRVPHPWR